MCIRDRGDTDDELVGHLVQMLTDVDLRERLSKGAIARAGAVSYTHLRAHETVLDLVCRLLLEKKKTETDSLNLLRTPIL